MGVPAPIFSRTFLRPVGAVICLALSVWAVLHSLSRDPYPSLNPEYKRPLSPPAVPTVTGFEPVRTVTDGKSPTVHSATAVELPNGDLRALWFGGSREGAADVSIWTARWHRESGSWAPPTEAVNRLALERETGLNIRKVGNPIVHRNSDDTLDLFVVGVSMGGWSGSAIYHLVSHDDGETFTDARRLIASPFLNVSTLVKGPAIEDGRGGLLLPVYHEFIVKYPILLRLDRERRVAGLQSFTEARGLLQPWPVWRRDGSVEIFLRRAKEASPPNIHFLASDDYGSTWSSANTLAIPNPNSSVAAVGIRQGTVLACNDLEKGRTQLSLLFGDTSNRESSWTLIHRIGGPTPPPGEEDIGKRRYSYPWLMQTSDGMLHLFFTWNRREIRHLRFDGRDWLTPNDE